MLPVPALVATLVVALIHFWFMYLEMFLWSKPTGMRIFGLSSDLAEQTKVLAANQGIYNGALAASLIWGAVAGGPEAALVLQLFVVVVGVYGAATLKPRVFLVQGAPALVAMALTWWTA